MNTIGSRSQNNKEVEFAIDYLENLRQTIGNLDPERIGQSISWLREARDKGNFIYICGNGGSASIAQQMVVDLVKGASYGHRIRFKMIGLTDSISTITAYANDIDYQSIFVEQLRNLAQEGDVLLAISGSGNSQNVLRAVEYANSIGCRTIAFTRSDRGMLKDLAHLTLAVPNEHMGRLEDCFFIMTHIIAYAFMEEIVP
jgi:D-sedoheptulose 7-phosphate isomerase